MNHIVTRFAPSPTGHLHLGHAYAALYAWYAAGENPHHFCLRIEDIDHTRCRDEYETALYQDLQWLGIAWQQPVLKQSERQQHYQQALNTLQDLGLLYPCFCTRKDIAAALSAPHVLPNVYPGTCRGLSLDSTTAEKPYSLRLDIAKAARMAGTDDHYDTIGDVVLSRRDIGIAYHLAVVVDDAAQGVTLVTRGQDLKAVTPLHRLLCKLLGLPLPQWEHHRLICDTATGERLSKRHQAQTLQSLRNQGLSAAEVIGLLPDDFRRHRH